MNRTQETYLALLRKAVWNTQDEVSMENIDMHDLVQWAQIQGVGSLIYDQILSLAPATSKAFYTSIKSACLQTMLQQQQWEPVIAQAFAALEQGGVHATLMKGFSYARLYPKPYLRSWGDLDIYVGTEQYHTACGILRHAFPEAIHHDEEWEELKHYCFVFPDGKAIELHRVSMDFLSRRDQAYWNRLDGTNRTDRLLIGQSPTIEVAVFEPRYDILFCFLHSWEHFTGSGIPLKQVCDMVLLLQHYYQSGCALPIADATNRPTGYEGRKAELEVYLLPKLKRLKMLEVWQYYGYMACQVMGIAPTQWPLLVDGGQCTVDGEIEQYGKRLYERVMVEGQARVKEYENGVNNRYEARDKAKRMNVFARKMLTLRQRLSSYYFLHQFAPRYARHILVEEIRKGLRRTLTGAKMIDY